MSLLVSTAVAMIVGCTNTRPPAQPACETYRVQACPVAGLIESLCLLVHAHVVCALSEAVCGPGLGKHLHNFQHLLGKSPMELDPRVAEDYGDARQVLASFIAQCLRMKPHQV